MTTTIAFICIAVSVLITSFISGILGMAGGMILMGVLLALPLIVACVVLAFTGTTFSTRVLSKMSDENFRRWTQWTVLTMGAIYLVSGVWMVSGFAKV